MHRPRRPGILGTLGAIALLGLSACASLHAPPATDGTPSVAWNGLQNALQLQMDSALWQTADSVSLVQGAVRFDAPQELLGYHARYTLDRNTAPVIPGAEPGPSAPLGREQIGHGIGARLPLIFSSAPLVLDLEDRYQALVTAQGNIDSGTRVAKLSWAPAGVNLGVNWQHSGQVLTHTLVCGVDGHLRVPLRGAAEQRPQTLELSGRECAVVAPDRGFEDLSVQTWSAAWNRRGRRTLSGLRLTVLEAEPDTVWTGPTTLPLAYELDVSHSRPVGLFQSSATVRLRHLSASEQLEADTLWSAETRLTRQLTPFAITASLRHAPDPLWFIATPGVDPRRNQIGLGLDFKRWITTALSTPSANMDLSLHWSEAQRLAQSPEGSVRWNFSLNW